MRERIFFCCPACQARMRASVHFSGKSCACPRCRHPIVVPPVVADEDTPVLVLDDQSRRSRWLAGLDLVAGRESR